MSFSQIAVPPHSRYERYTDDPDFTLLATSLSGKLSRLHSSTSRLRTQLSLLGTRKDTPPVRERVHRLLEETRAGFAPASADVKRLQAWPDVMSPVQRYAQEKLARQLQDVLQEFQSVQRLAAEKTRLALPAPEPEPEGEEEAVDHEYREDEREGEGEGGQRLLVRQSDVEIHGLMIEDRESQLRDIEQGIQDISIIFGELGRIVGEQAPGIDRIDESVARAAQHQKLAAGELGSAHRRQKSMRKCHCWFLLGLITLLAFVLLMVSPPYFLLSNAVLRCAVWCL